MDSIGAVTAMFAFAEVRTRHMFRNDFWEDLSGFDNTVQRYLINPIRFPFLSCGDYFVQVSSAIIVV
jgi:hypothetical protein